MADLLTPSGLQAALTVDMVERARRKLAGAL